MNAGSTPGYRPTITVSDLDRIDVHLAEPERSAVWWVELVAYLDRLDDALALHRADVEGPGGLHAQVLADAPRVAPAVARLEIEHDRLSVQIRDARLRVGAIAGDPEAADEAIAITGELVARLRRHQSDADDLVHEAYRVDIGGE
jgi:hypothetical protein